MFADCAAPLEIFCRSAGLVMGIGLRQRTADLLVRLGILALCVCLCTSTPLQAADTRQQLDDVETALRAKQAEAKAAQEALTGGEAAANAIQLELQRATREEATQQRAFDRLTLEMAGLQEKGAAVRAVLRRTAQREAGALGMMLRLSRLPAALWWLYDGITLDQQKRLLLLRGAALGLNQQAETMRRNLLEAERLRVLLVAKQDELLAAKVRLLERADRLNGMIAERQNLVMQHRAEFAVLRREMTQLASAATDLRALLDKMARQAETAPTKQGKVKAKPDIEDAGKAKKEPNLVEGSLLPVSGMVMRGYGVRDDLGISSRGLTLSTKLGARVVAPLNGKAVFVGPFKSYGTIVILQHEGGLHSLLAGFSQVDLELGQKVLAGEPIGLAGAGKNGKSAEIYFELRRKGEPINPLVSRKRQT